MQTQAIAQLDSVSKYYGSIPALLELSFSVRAGESLGLLGPNGAGKTTALHLLMGMFSPSQGKVSVFGHDPVHHRQQLASRVNFSSAYTTLPGNLTVIENLRVFAQLYAVERPADKLDSLLELFELGRFARRLTGSLSSGERTRLNLCKCFLNDPELVYLDEPTASLDPEVAEHTRRILVRLQKQYRMAILYTSHNMQEVETLCNAVVFLHHGRAVAQGSPASLKQQYGARNLEEVFIRIVRRKEKA